MPRVIEAFKQFFDDAGDPLVNGWLRFTESGTNNTDKDTFADSSETIANSNPVQLDGAGRCPNVFGSGSYRVTSFEDDGLGSPGTQIEQFDPVGGSFGAGSLDDWNSESIYSQGDIVTGSDGKYYRSITTNNQGNDPISSPANWEEIRFLGVYNASVSYSIGDVIQETSGVLYRSLTDTNTGNTPASSPTDWQIIGSDGNGDLNTETFNSSGVWSRPAGVDNIYVTLVGGGGGAGSNTASFQYSASGGGGGGEVKCEWLAVTDDVAVTIGSGGTGASADNTAGSAGSDSTLSVGASLTARGGNGGGPANGLDGSGSGHGGGRGAFSSSGHCAAGGGGGAGGNGGNPHISTNSATWAGDEIALPNNGEHRGGSNYQKDITSGQQGYAGKGGAGLLGYGGGGGGGASSGSIDVGDASDGGGIGRSDSGSGVSGTANTGGGGGGVGSDSSTLHSGGSGGSGVCIIQWWT